MALPVTAPVIEACADGAWTLVFTGTVGQLHKKINGPIYLGTHRPTGGGAPTGIGEGVRIFDEADHIPISFSDIADVYVWCMGGAGSVRVDG